MRNDPMSNERRATGKRRVPGESLIERIAGRAPRAKVGPGDRFFHRFGIQDPYAVVQPGASREDRLTPSASGSFTYLSAEGYRRDVNSVRYHLLERLSHGRTSSRAGERLHQVGPMAAENGLAPRLLAAPPIDFTTLVDTPTIVEVPVEVPAGRPRVTAPRERRSGRAPRKAAPIASLPQPAPQATPRPLRPVAVRPTEKRAPLATGAVRRVPTASLASRILRSLLQVAHGQRRNHLTALMELAERGDVDLPVDRLRDALATAPPMERAHHRASVEPEVAARSGLRRVTAQSPVVRVLERRAASPDEVFAHEPVTGDVRAPRAPRPAPRSPRKASTRAVAAPVRTPRVARRAAGPSGSPTPGSAHAVQRSVPTLADGARDLRRAQRSRRSMVGTVAARRAAPIASALGVTDTAAASGRARAPWASWSDAAPDAEPVERSHARVAPTERALRRSATANPTRLADAPMAYVRDRMDAPAQIVADAKGPTPAAPAEVEAPRGRRRAPRATSTRGSSTRGPSSRGVGLAASPATSAEPASSRARVTRLPATAPLDVVTGRRLGSVDPAPAGSVRASRRSEAVSSLDGAGRREFVPRPAAYLRSASVVGATTAAAGAVGPAAAMPRTNTRAGVAATSGARSRSARADRARPVAPPTERRAASADHEQVVRVAGPDDVLGAVARAAVRGDTVARVDRRGRALATPAAITPPAPELVRRLFVTDEPAARPAEAEVAAPAARPAAPRRAPARARQAAGQAPRGARATNRVGDKPRAARTRDRRPVVAPSATAPMTRASRRDEQVQEARSALPRAIPRSVAPSQVSPGFAHLQAEDERPEQMAPTVRASVRDRAVLSVDDRGSVRSATSMVAPVHTPRAIRFVGSAPPAVYATTERAQAAPEQQSARPPRRTAAARARSARPVSGSAEPALGAVPHAAARAVAARGSAERLVSPALPVADLSRLLAAITGRAEPAVYREDGPDRVASDRVASDRVASGRVASGRVASGRVASGGVASGGVASGGVASGRVVSGRVAPDGVASGRVSTRRPAPVVFATEPARTEPSSTARGGVAEQRVRGAVHAALRSSRPAAVTPGARRVVQVTPSSAPSRNLVEARVVQHADGRIRSARAERTTADGRRSTFAVDVSPVLARAAGSGESPAVWAERRAAPGSSSVGGSAARAARRAAEARPLRSARRADPALPVGLPVGIGPMGLDDQQVDVVPGEREPLATSLADLNTPRRRRGAARATDRRSARPTGTRRQAGAERTSPLRRFADAAPAVAGDGPTGEEGVEPTTLAGPGARGRDRQWARRSTASPVADREELAEQRQAGPRTAGGLLSALARSGDAEDVVRVILERSSAVASAASALGGEARSLVDRIVKTAGAEREQRVSAQVASMPQFRTINRRILTPAPSQSFGGSSGHGGPTSTSVQGVGASGVMKLAGKLMKLIHLAENERRKADAQREIRMAEETGSTRREAGAGQTGGENVASQTMNLKQLQQQVLDSILHKLEEQRWRRDDPDGPNSGS
jgi:hypothetical protein